MNLNDITCGCFLSFCTDEPEACFVGIVWNNMNE